MTASTVPSRSGSRWSGGTRNGIPAAADLPLRAHEPLGHRRLGDEERAGDLLRRQAAERAQRQRDLRLARECGMAAREDQAQPFVGNRLVLLAVCGPARAPRAAPSCAGASARAGSGRSPGCARSSAATRRGCRGRPRAASARARLRRPPGRRPRRARRRRARGPGSRGCAPTPPGRRSSYYEPSSSKTITGRTSTEPWRGRRDLARPTRSPRRASPASIR